MPVPSHPEPPVACLKLECPGRVVEFFFPQVGVMRDAVTRIFQGQEYPLIKLPEYEPNLIVDIGANVGAAAMFFHVTYPAARVICYEPSATNLQFLHRNFANAQNVEIRPYGLFDSDRSTKLFRGRDFPMQNSVAQAAETSDEFEQTELHRASVEFDRAGLTDISILKIDTEGCELPILRDLGERLQRVDFLYVEYHSDDDRRAIDELVYRHMLLTLASAATPHRGRMTYISRRIVQRYPQLNELEIKLGANA